MNKYKAPIEVYSYPDVRIIFVFFNNIELNMLTNYRDQSVIKNIFLNKETALSRINSINSDGLLFHRTKIIIAR